VAAGAEHGESAMVGWARSSWGGSLVLLQVGRSSLGARASDSARSPNLAGRIEVKCHHCGQAVEEEIAACPHCGRTISGEQANRESREDSYLMLVTANVLRLRRQWALAEAKVSEVLRRDPENSAAYSVLGDISRDRGEMGDAIQWYKLALQYNPTSAGDRKKLEAVIDRVFSRRGRGLVQRARGALDRGLDALTAEVRAARRPPPVTLVVGVALGLMFLIAIFAIVVSGGEEPRVAPIPRQTPSGAFDVTRPAAPGPGPEESKEARPAGQVLDEVADELGSQEAELLDQLRQCAGEVDPNARVISVEINPVQSMVSIRLSMPGWWSKKITRRDILRVASSLAAVAAGWDQRLSGVRVRCDMRQRGMPDRLAMVAEGEAQQLAKLGEETGAAAAEVFSFVWWHPELRAEVPRGAGQGDG